MTDFARSLQIRGVIRFSYLSESGFVLSGQGLDAVRRTLFDPARLERRFRLFEALTLPSLLAQDDPNFQVSVLIGHEMPESAKKRLRVLLRDVPQAVLVGLPPMQHYQSVKKAFRRLPNDPGVSHNLTFRLDDDDAMRSNTISRLRAIAAQHLAHRDPACPLVIAFNRGYYLEPRGVDTVLREQFERTPLGIGLGLLEPMGPNDNVFRRNHRHLAQYYDVYSEVAEPMFIRSVHPDNDSEAKPSGRLGTMTQTEIETDVEAHFGVSMRALRAL